MMAQIRGLSQALETLKTIDPVLYRESQKMLRKDAKPLVNDARSRIPGYAPLSGWREGTGRTSGGFPDWDNSAKRRVNLRVRRQKLRGRQGGRRVLVRIVQGSASGAVFDMAGRLNPGNPIDHGLKPWFGEASRSMWPAAEANLGVVEDSVRRSVREMEKMVNERLSKNPRLPIGS